MLHAGCPQQACGPAGGELGSWSVVAQRLWGIFFRILEVLASGAAVVGRNECSYGKR